jgi:hypothetical protein
VNYTFIMRNSLRIDRYPYLALRCRLGGNITCFKVEEIPSTLAWNQVVHERLKKVAGGDRNTRTNNAIVLDDSSIYFF